MRHSQQQHQHQQQLLQQGQGKVPHTRCHPTRCCPAKKSPELFPENKHLVFFIRDVSNSCFVVIFELLGKEAGFFGVAFTRPLRKDGQQQTATAPATDFDSCAGQPPPLTFLLLLPCSPWWGWV
jgi:hypothetical protein